MEYLALGLVVLVVGLLVGRSVVMWWTGMSKVIEGLTRICQLQKIQIEQLAKIVEQTKPE